MLRTLVSTKVPWRSSFHTLSLQPSLHSLCIPKPSVSVRYASGEYRRAGTLDLVKSIRKCIGGNRKVNEADTTAYIQKQLQHWLPKITRPTAACESVINMLINEDCTPEARVVFDYMVENGMVPSAATQLTFSGSTSSSVFKEKRMKAAVETIGNAVKPKMSEDAVNKTVSKLLDQYLPHFTNRAELYEGIIFTLVKKRRIHEATAVYARMLKAGFVASPITDARLMTLSMALCEDEKDAHTYLQGLGTLFAQDDFTGDDVLELIYLGGNYGIKDELCTEIINMYMESRPEDEDVDFDPRLIRKLIASQAASGKVDEAMKTLTEQSEKGNLPSSPKLSQHMYSEILSAIRYVSPGNHEAIGTVLDVMSIHGVKPGVAIFNILISDAVRNRNIQDAFRIYHMMKAMKDDAVKPDAFTYGSLWNAISELYSPLPARRNRNREVIIAPRQLYREMISTLIPFSIVHKKKQNPKSPNVLTSSLLDVTIRAFLNAKDYPGAFVVVRSFFTWHIRPRVKTYNVVLRRILGRLNRELKSMRRVGESRWADRYIGLRHPPTINVLNGIKVDDTMAAHLLTVARRPDWSLDARPYQVDGSEVLQPVYLVHAEPSKKPDYVVPTPKMLDGSEEPPDDMAFSQVPIERMLRRAILADTIRTYDSPPAGTIVSRAIQEAKNEMIPDEADQTQ